MTLETELKPKRGLTDPAVDAARAAFEKGGGPRDQIDAARAIHGNPRRHGRIGYQPHEGRREREKRLKRLQKNAVVSLIMPDGDAP